MSSDLLVASQQTVDNVIPQDFSFFEVEVMRERDELKFTFMLFFHCQRGAFLFRAFQTPLRDQQ
jgi:hypothetical protein